MKAFEFPEINVITFAVDDIITLSNTGEWSGWDNLSIPSIE